MGAASVIGGWTSSLPEKSVHSLELRLAKCFLDNAPFNAWIGVNYAISKCDHHGCPNQES